MGKYRNLRKVELANLKAKIQSVIHPDAIFYSSWEYEQTNVRFYQIISVSGFNATIREVDQDRKMTELDSGVTSAIKDRFIGKAFDLRIKLTGLKINMVENLKYWNGKPIRWSYYH